MLTMRCTLRALIGLRGSGGPRDETMMSRVLGRGEVGGTYEVVVVGANNETLLASNKAMVDGDNVARLRKKKDHVKSGSAEGVKSDNGR